MLEFLVQTVIDWIRDVLAGVVGWHAEEFIGKYIKRAFRRRKLLRGKGARGIRATRKSKK